MIEVVKALQDHIKAKMPSIKKVERWNNQLSREGKNVTLHLPSAFLEFVNIQTKTIGRNTQICTGVLRVRLGDKATATGQELALIAQNLYIHLQGFNGDPLMVGLERLNIYQDTNIDNLEQLVQDFAIKYYDESKSAALTKPPAELEVQK